MQVLQIIEIYKQLCIDAKNIEQLEIWLNTPKEHQILHSLYKSNQGYRQQLILSVHHHFPATATDIAGWSEKEWNDWLDLLIEHPVFWQEKQETLIGLFWSLDGKGILKNTEKVVSLCTHLEMVDYAANPYNGATVNTLMTLIEKYATLMQAEQFQNKVDLVINDIH